MIMDKTELTTKKRSKFPVFPLLILIFVFALGHYLYKQLFAPSVSKNIVFTVKQGSAFNQVALTLEEQGHIPDANLLKMYARLTGVDSKLKAGDFLLKTGQSPVQVVNNLVNGSALLVRLTIPEGFTATQIANRVGFDLPSVDPLVELVQASRLPEFVIADFINNPPISPEGYLFPDTYFYDKEKPHEVYLAMYKQMIKVLENLFITYPDNPITSRQLTLHEAVILASVVEKEAMIDNERPIIAGVFLRRLNKGMLLQSCATVTYVLEKPVARLTYNDLAIDSPYNTYLYPGLPIGPVGNPGKKSLEAVFNPEMTNYLFFVAKGDGSHVFSHTYQEHLRAQVVHEDWLRENSKARNE